MFTLGCSWNFLYLYFLYILFFTRQGCQLAQCVYLHVTERNGLWNNPSFENEFFLYKIDRSENVLLYLYDAFSNLSIVNVTHPKLHKSASKTISLNKILISSLWKVSIFCALQGIRFVQMTFTGVAFKMSFIFFETIMLVIMIYILRIMIFLCLTKCSLKVYMSYN